MSERVIHPIVTVILATFNGERFLHEQLDSLEMQNRKPDRLVLRDDGSADRSVEIVRAWANQTGIRLQHLSGPRLGPARSFLVALQAAESADIFMFCDQDDVWEADKIERGVEVMKWGEGAPPTLYATRLRIVDEHRQTLGLSPLPTNLSFSSAAYESVLTGCTMAFNSAFRELLIRRVPTCVGMHDWWCYLLATSARGAALFYDEKPTVQYRQHGGNAIGAGPTGVSALLARWRKFVGSDCAARSRQLQEFYEIYSDDLTSDALDILLPLLSTKKDFGSRVRATLTQPIHRQTFFSSLTTRIALLTNRF